MTTSTSKRTAFKVTSIYRDPRHLDPMLYQDEDPTAYAKFRDRIHDRLHPEDEFEEILADDYAHLHWEVMRLRRLLLKHIASREPEALDQLLEGLGLDEDARAKIVTGFASGGAPDIADAERLLMAAGHDLETVRARAVAIYSEEIGRLQALITAAEKRRNRCVRDLARHRADMRKLARKPPTAPKDDDGAE